MAHVERGWETQGPFSVLAQMRIISFVVYHYHVIKYTTELCDSLIIRANKTINWKRPPLYDCL